MRIGGALIALLGHNTRTRSNIHVPVPASPEKLFDRTGPLLLKRRSPASFDDALHKLLSIEALERPAQAEHFPQD